MTAHRRIAAAVLLTGALASGAVITLVGCAGSPDSSGAASASPKASHAPNAALPGIINCLKTHGVTVPAGSSGKQLKSDLRALPESRRQGVLAACGSLMPSKFLQKAEQGKTAKPSGS